MSPRTKITLSLDRALVERIEEESERLDVSKSRLVEEALRDWQRKRLEQELKSGYKAMAEMDRATAEENLAASWETLE